MAKDSFNLAHSNFYLDADPVGTIEQALELSDFASRARAFIERTDLFDAPTPFKVQAIRLDGDKNKGIEIDFSGPNSSGVHSYGVLRLTHKGKLKYFRPSAGPKPRLLDGTKYERSLRALGIDRFAGANFGLIQLKGPR